MRIYSLHGEYLANNSCTDKAISTPLGQPTRSLNCACKKQEALVGRGCFDIPTIASSSAMLRAYAVAQVGGRQASYGQAETSVVVRRKLSLTASMPRVVRMGDEFQAGVIVTAANSGDNKECTASISCKVRTGCGFKHLVVLLSSHNKSSLEDVTRSTIAGDGACVQPYNKSSVAVSEWTAHTRSPSLACQPKYASLCLPSNTLSSLFASSGHGPVCWRCTGSAAFLPSCKHTTSVADTRKASTGGEMRPSS